MNELVYAAKIILEERFRIMTEYRISGKRIKISRYGEILEFCSIMRGRRREGWLYLLSAPIHPELSFGVLGPLQ